MIFLSFTCLVLTALIGFGFEELTEMIASTIERFRK